MLNLVCLFNLDAYAHAVDARLDQDSLVLIARDGEGIQQDFGGGLRFNLGDVVSF